MKKLAIALLSVSALMSAVGCGVAPAKSDDAVESLSVPSTNQRTGCNAILKCMLDSDKSQYSYINCVENGKPEALLKFVEYAQCAAGQCYGDTDTGTGPCSSPDQCVICVASGPSPSGHASIQNMPAYCTNTFGQSDAQASQIQDPKCGACVDQLGACIDDL